MLETYQPSGRFSPLVFAWLIPFLLLMAGAAWVYNFLINLIPFMIVSVLLVGGLAVAAFFASHVLMTLGKCRSVMMATAIGLFAGAFAVGASHYFAYMDWAAGMRQSLAQPDAELVQSIEADEPGAFAELKNDDGSALSTEQKAEVIRALISVNLTMSSYFEERVATGWSISRRGSGGLPITGVFVYIVFAIEAIIVMIAGMIGATTAAKMPYCEVTDRWMEEQEVLNVAADRAEVQRIAQATSVNQLLALPHKARLGDTRLIYKLYRSPETSETAYLSISMETTEKDKDGNDTTNSSDIWTAIALTPQQAEELTTLVDGV